MKKILLSLLLVPSLALAQLAQMPSFKVCADREQLNSALTDFGEMPLLAMTNVNTIEDAKIESYKAILFANPKTGTWTLAEQWNDNFFCVVAMGSDLIPFSNINNTREKINFKE